MKIKIAVLPGDGIGPEVVAQALNVTQAVCDIFEHKLSYEYGICGVDAIRRVGNPYPDKTHELCMNSDAVLFGAVGDSLYDNDPVSKIRPEQGLLAMRHKLGLYANIRPVATYDSLLHKSPLRQEVIKGADFICIRELTGGLYFGKPQGRSENGEFAYDTCIYSRDEIERIVRVAFEFAMKRRKKLTIVDKANILATSRLWREVAHQIEKEYPEVTTDYIFVDHAAMRLVQCPTEFDVIVTENMFGDILTDEAAVISGSMGLLPSASIGLHTSLYEPVHGSWPQAAGQNRANPLATILSSAMMFEYAFGSKEEGMLIRKAVEASMEAGIRTEDIQIAGEKSFTTSEVGHWIANYLRMELK